jgi:HTH-type transcriptional regulator/antitoxin HigA
MAENQYWPDEVSAPGETLQEILEERGLTQADLADKTGRSPKAILDIIEGRATLTPETALLLEHSLGVPASFWNQRERQYRDFLSRRDQRARAGSR